MGQGHSTTKHNHQSTSKYGPQTTGVPETASVPTTATSKPKKRGGRSASTKNSPSSSGGGRGNTKKTTGSFKEGSRTMGSSDRRLPALPTPIQSVGESATPPQRPSRHYSAPKSSSSSSSSHHHHHHHHPTQHRSQDRHSNAPPTLPSRQFSLNSGSAGGPTKITQIVTYFNRYKEEGEDVILARGTEQFCNDLNVDPEEFIVLVLAWKFEASQMCRFTREEFINGCQKMEAYDARSLRNRFPQLLDDARTQFKDLYQFTFSFGLDHSTGQRSLSTDLAVQLWELVFTQDRPQILDHWFKFLDESGTRGISRDTWCMFLDFCQNVEPDLSNYDESEAWPSLFDDFVEYELVGTS